MQLFYLLMVQAPSAQGQLLKRFGSVHPCRPPGLITMKARPLPVPANAGRGSTTSTHELCSKRTFHGSVN